MVVSGEKGMLEERLRLCAELWATGIRCEGYFNKADDKLLSQFQSCEAGLIPYGNTGLWLCRAMIMQKKISPRISDDDEEEGGKIHYHL